MTAPDFIIELFCQVDEQMAAVPKHSQASLWPSEVTTIGLLHAIKGLVTELSTAGWETTIGSCSPNGRNVLLCFGCCASFRTAPSTSWPSHPGCELLIPVVSS